MRSLPELRALALLDAWTNRDLDAFGALLAEDVSWYDPAMPHPPAEGRDSVVDFANSVLAAFPDFSYSIRGQICVAPDESACAIPFRITGTHSATLRPPGFSPTLRSATFDGIDYLHFRGDLVDRIETYFDPISAAAQLTGLILRPAAGSLPERIMVTAQRLVAMWARRDRRSTHNRS